MPDTPWTIAAGDSGVRRVEWRERRSSKQAATERESAVAAPGISSSSAPTVVETPATSPVFRIGDYELEGRSARNLKSRSAVLERVVPDGENGLFEYPGSESFPERRRTSIAR